MGAYVAATVVTPSPLQALLGGAGAHTNPANVNDGVDATFSSYVTPQGIGAGSHSLSFFPLASIESRDWSPSLGAVPQRVVVRVRHSVSVVYSGDPIHITAQRVIQSITQYSVDGGGTWFTIASHQGPAGTDLNLADHVDTIVLTGVTPSALRVRECLTLIQFGTNASYTGGTFTIDVKNFAIEIIANTNLVASIMGFM